MLQQSARVERAPVSWNWKALPFALVVGCGTWRGAGRLASAHAQGGPCSDASLITDQGIVILTFPSEAKETDWLHQNDRGGAFMYRELPRRLRFLPTGPCSRA